MIVRRNLRKIQISMSQIKCGSYLPGNQILFFVFLVTLPLCDSSIIPCIFYLIKIFTKIMGYLVTIFLFCVTVNTG